MKFFTSDTHFFHKELLKDKDFAPRDFDNIEDMHAAIIKNWNDRVTDRDSVYHFGDVALDCMRRKKRANEQIIILLNS